MTFWEITELKLPYVFSPDWKICCKSLIRNLFRGPPQSQKSMRSAHVKIKIPIEVSADEIYSFGSVIHRGRRLSSVALPCVWRFEWKFDCCAETKHPTYTRALAHTRACDVTGEDRRELEVRPYVSRFMGLVKIPVRMKTVVPVSVVVRMCWCLWKYNTKTADTKWYYLRIFTGAFLW